MSLDLTADLYEACQQISPRHPDYATQSIEDAFDWSSLSCCLFDRLYLVVFRSLWQPEAVSTSCASTTTALSRRRLRRAASSATSKATRTSRASACRSASGRRASRPDRPLMGPRTAQPPTSVHRCTSHTRSNVTGYGRSERRSSSSRFRSRAGYYYRGGKRRVPPV